MFEKYLDKEGNEKWRLAPVANELQPELQKFLDFYSVDAVIVHPERKPNLKPRDKRKCSFCGNSIPLVTFKKDAHTIPQFTSNRHLVSDFECDGCNLTSGK